MNNIVPDSVDDRINVLFKQLHNANNTITNFNKNFVDASDNSLIITSNTFTVDTNNAGILLGDKTTPDSMILYGTGNPDTIIATNVPDGSIYLTKDNSGTGYIKQNNQWKVILTDFADVTLNNLNISGNAIVGNNLVVDKNVNVSGIMTVSGNVIIDGDLDVSGSLTSNSMTTGNVSGTSLTTINNITCGGNIISIGNISSLGKITGNSLNINSKLNIDPSGNLDTCGNINATGNITGNIVLDGTLTVTELDVNSKANIDQSGNLDTNGFINSIGNITTNGNINSDGNITTLGLLTANTLNVNSNLDIDSNGNLNTNGNISGNNIISTNSISGNTLNINNKLTVSNTGILTTSGSINVSGNVNVNGNINISGGIIVNSLNINSKLTIDSSGNLVTDGSMNVSGNINNSGNIVSKGSLTAESLTVKSSNTTVTTISNSGNINTNGYIYAGDNISGSTINNLYLTPNATGFSISGGTTSKTLTINNTLTFSGTDNTTITFPSTSQTLMGLTDSQDFTNKTIKLNAGTTTQAPLQFTSGTNLTNASGGAIEYDGNNYYATSIDCSSSAIRKILPNMSYYRIDSDRDTINTIDMIYTYNVFPSGTFTMDANTYYIIEWNVNWLANFTSYIRYDIVASSALQYIVMGVMNISTTVSMYYGTTTTTISSIPNIPITCRHVTNINYTGTYSHTLRAYILNGNTNGATIKLQVYTTNANITLKRGSRIFITKMPNANFGSFS